MEQPVTDRPIRAAGSWLRDGVDDTEAQQRAGRFVPDSRPTALEMFAGVAAHELMSPLIVAEACAHMVEERLNDPADSTTCVELHDLIRVLSRMRILVETLLEDARSSGEPLELRNVSVQRLVDDAIELLGREIRAHGTRVIAAGLPVVQADPVLLGAVVNNLLLNALRYGPRFGGEVRVRSRRERAAWRISVTSQGPTIPVEDRARIFEPYFRGSHERRAAGAGLGLAICRSFVERHGGEIGVRPVRGGGNRFHFTIPLTGRPLSS
jgi:signal transduction histidine kinase